MLRGGREPRRAGGHATPVRTWTGGTRSDSPPPMTRLPADAMSSSSSSRIRLLGCPDPVRYRLLPTILVTVCAAAGFSIFKFILISEIALDFTSAKNSLPFAWMRRFLEARPDIPLQEAVSQGLAATFTIGILVGFLVNAPLAGAWRVGPMFVLSALGMALGAIIAIPGLANPWSAALWVGLAYGTACAARGKAVPLLSAGSGRDNTVVSGLINAGLVVGLLLGTIVGSQLALLFIGDPHSSTPTVGRVWDADWMAHLILVGFLVVTALVSRRVVLPDQAPVPFMHGLRELVGVTSQMVVRHWALLISGGIAWGISSAAGLAVLIFCIIELKMGQLDATYLGLFAAVGAITGNLVSKWFVRRRWVMLWYLFLAAAIGLFPYLVHTWWQAAVAMTVVGLTYMIPTNVIDARFLALAGREGRAGWGGTVFSMVHNVFILAIGFGLAALLFTDVLTARTQFLCLSGLTLLALTIAAFAPLRSGDASRS